MNLDNASDLGITIRTVKEHRGLMEKMANWDQTT